MASDSEESLESQSCNTDGRNSTESLSPQDKLLKALETNNLEHFLQLLEHPEVDPNYEYGKDKKYTTCLKYICHHEGHHDFLTELLNRKNVKPNLNEIHPEPIHLASKAGNVEVLGILLKDRRTKVNATDKDGRTALHYAVKDSGNVDKLRVERYIDCVRLLMERNDFLINLPNYRGFTAIYEAANYGCEEVVEAMLKIGGRNLDLDSRNGNNKTAREIIKEKFPDIKLPEVPPRTTDKRLIGLHTQLLKAMHRKQFEIFQNILHSVNDNGYSQIDPNFWSRSHSATLLEIAIKEKNSNDYIEVLLKAGADPNTVNPVTKQTPLHLAVEMNNLKALNTLLNKARKIDINIQDSDGKTALAIAAERDNKNIVKYILKFVERENIYIKEDDLILITTNFAGIVAELKFDISKQKKQDIQSKLFQYLYRQEIQEFCEHYTSELDDEDKRKTFDNGIVTFLQCAIQKGMVQIVEFLLKNKVDPNAVTEKGNESPPLIMAACSQNYKIIDIFLGLPKESTFNINVTDEKGNTALHFAALNCDLKLVVKLLRYGADMNVRNVYDKLPLTENTLEGLLDKCITNKGHPSNEDFRIIFDFDFILSLKNQVRCQESTDLTLKASSPENTSCRDHKLQQNDQSNVSSVCIRKRENVDHETDSEGNIEMKDKTSKQEAEKMHGRRDKETELSCLLPTSSENRLSKQDAVKSTSTEKDHCNEDRKQEEPHLHPSSTCVNIEPQIYSKKQNVSTFQSAIRDDNIVPEMELLFQILRHKEHRNVVSHPVVRCLLQFKWHLTKPFYFMNLILMSVFVLHLNCFLLMDTEEISRTFMTRIVTSFDNYTRDFLYVYLYVVVLISVILLILREMLQAFMNFGSYYKNPMNALDLSTIFVTSLSLFWKSEPTLVVLGILLSWLELIIICGRLRKFSLKVEMLKKVSMNYFYCLLSYVFIILPFAFIFYSLFHKEGEHNFFTNPVLTLIKTLIMMVGEFQTEDFIKSDADTFFSPLFMIVFALSLFFSSMVLFNLLTGLAVSDTKTIIDNAKQLSLESQLNLMYEVESIINECYNFIEKFSISCCILCNFGESFKRQLASVMMFSANLSKRQQIIIYPNNKAKTVIDDVEGHEMKIDSDILGDAVKILFERGNVMENERNKSVSSFRDLRHYRNDSRWEDADRIQREEQKKIIEILGQHELQLNENEANINEIKSKLDEILSHLHKLKP